MHGNWLLDVEELNTYIYTATCPDDENTLAYSEFGNTDVCIDVISSDKNVRTQNIEALFSKQVKTHNLHVNTHIETFCTVFVLVLVTNITVTMHTYSTHTSK